MEIESNRKIPHGRPQKRTPSENLQAQVVNDDLESIANILENIPIQVIQGAIGSVLSPIALGDYTLPIIDRSRGTIPKVSRPDKRRSLRDELNLTSLETNIKSTNELLYWRPKKATKKGIYNGD